jgi:tetratricopeptide (TPR) repeat protein
MSDHAKRQLGEFELLRELGRGGMGVVYEAVQTSLGRRVALKVLAEGLGLTPAAVERFRREAATAARLHHTNIVPVYATGISGDTLFYAMELIDGPSLDRVLLGLRNSQQRATPNASGQTVAYAEPSPVAAASGLSVSSLSSGAQYFDTVARMIAGVADALDYAHRQGVLHRDIKPANLLLSAAGRLSLNDFGLARLLEEPGMTLTGEFLGTPAYASPEQITGGRVPIDQRTDVYSLGATLYELLTLRPPFVGASRDQVLAQILQKDPVPPRRWNAKIPIDLETICLKALDKDPDRRYASAQALGEDLQRYLNRFAISARRAGPVARFKKWAKRKPGLAAALGGLLLAMLTAVFFGWQLHREGQLRREDKRRNALDVAMTAALIGDFTGSKQATTEAQKLGTEDWEVWLLSGFLNFHAGRTKEAVADYLQAVELRPNSVVAQALLCYAYANQSQWAKASAVRSRLEPMKPLTPEERLFKGVALAFFVPEHGLPLMDEAIRERPTAIGYLLRALPRAVRAIDTADVRDAELAVEDAEFARRLLPAGNPVVTWTSLQARLAACTAYRVHGQDSKSAEALAQADRDAEALRAFPEMPEAISAREWHQFYRDHLAGRPTDMVAEFRAARQRTGNDIMLWLESLNLFALGRDEEALQILESNRRGDYSNTIRVMLLRGLRGDSSEALTALQTSFPARDDPDWHVERYRLLLLIGESAEAAQVARAFKAAGRKVIWYPPALSDLIISYYADDGSATEEVLLRAAEPRRTVLSDVCHMIGIRRLAAGDRDGAKAMFRRAADNLAITYESWEYSLAFLTRMERDPAWPKWIAAKKGSKVP